MYLMYSVLLYYKYTSIADPQDLMVKQKELCSRLNILGRILIADEGINGTVCGTPEAIEEYQKETEQYPGLEDMEWKFSTAEEQVFPRLRVRVRKEIVTLGLRYEDRDVSIENKADYIEPEELAKLYDEEQEFYIIDARNKYEGTLGKFKEAIVPDIQNFRDFPEYVKNNLQHLKDKPVVTYCTGGIRCEKASAFLKESGFSNVKQLHGGVHVYAEKTKGKHFDGKLYVFDKRREMDINLVNPRVISSCEFCQVEVAHYIDCQAFGCPAQFICCETCEEKYNSRCPEHVATGELETQATEAQGI